MNKAAKIALIGAAVVLVFDAAWAAISIWTGIEYAWFSIGSFVLYFVFSFLGALRSKWFFGAAIGAFIGLVDSTLGWAISWIIGPGKLALEMNSIVIVMSIVFVVFVAALLGLIAGALSLVKKSNA